MGVRQSKVCVVGSEYCDRKAVELTVARKVTVLKPDSSIFVGDYKQNYVFKIEETTSAYGMPKKRVLLDSKGDRVLTIRHKATLRSQWGVYKGNSVDKKNLIFTAEQSTIMGSNNKELKVFLNKEEKKCDFRVASSGKVYVEDDRTNSIAEICDGMVKVNPKVDQAFVISLVVILDGINMDQRWEKYVSKILFQGAMIVISNAI